MRNLKRVLSLALASVMLMGMMVMGASAADTKVSSFPDGDKVTYKEAVEVMVGTGIVAGTDGGKIDPQGVITRETAAKIMAYMKLGKTVADALTADKAPFSDVAANRWSAGYIAYCANQGIIGGYEGAFMPETPVTGIQLAKMLLITVGYGVNDEYVGSSWSLNATKDGLTLGVFSGNTAGAADKAATREETMLYAFNTLTKIVPVNYSSVLGAYYDTTVMLGDVKNKTLGVSVYDLKKVDETGADGLVGYQWAIGNKTPFSSVYGGSAVIASLTSTSGTSKGDLYKLGSWNENVTLYVNGTNRGTVASSTLAVKGSSVKIDAGYQFKGAQINFCDTKFTTGSGNDAVTTEQDGKIDTITVSIAYLAKVTGEVKATASADRQIKLDIYDTTGIVKKTVDSDKFAKGDFVLVTPSEDNTDGFASPTAIEAADSIDGTVSTFKTGSVTIDGTAYGYNTSYATGLNLGKTDGVLNNPDFTSTYTAHLDAFGNIIGMSVKEEGTGTLSYGYVSKIEAQAAGEGLLNGDKDAAVKVKIIYLDGTTEVVDYAIKVASAATTVGGGDTIPKGDAYIIFDGKSRLVASSLTGVITADLYSYTKNGDGEITLSKKLSDGKTTPTVGVMASANVTVKKGETKINITSAGAAAKDYYANSATNLVTVTANGTGAATVTGYKNFPTDQTFTIGSNLKVVVVRTGNTITNMLVVGGELAADTAYTYGVYMGVEGQTADGTKYNFFVDGEKVTYLATADVSANIPGTNDSKVCQITLDDKGELVGLAKTADAIVVGDELTVIDSNYIVTDNSAGSLPLAEGYGVYDITDAASANWGEGTLEVGQTITYCTQKIGGEDQVVAIFITAAPAEA